MNCAEFKNAYQLWLDRMESVPLSKVARNHQLSCPECDKFATDMFAVDSLLRSKHEPLPIPDLSHIRDRIIAAHQPGEIPLPPLTSLRAAVILAIPAISLWVVSLFVPAGFSGALQLLLVFAATSLLLTKFFLLGNKH